MAASAVSPILTDTPSEATDNDSPKALAPTAPKPTLVPKPEVLPPGWSVRNGAICDPKITEEGRRWDRLEAQEQQRNFRLYGSY
jgi:hypothetical protein